MALACACAAPRAAHSGESSHLGLKRAVSRRRYPPAPVGKRHRRMASDRLKSLQLFPCSRYFVRFDSLAVIPAPEKPRSCGRGGAVCATSPVPPEQRRFALPIHLRHLQPLPGRLVLKTRAASGRIARRIARAVPPEEAAGRRRLWRAAFRVRCADGCADDRAVSERLFNKPSARLIQPFSQRIKRGCASECGLVREAGAGCSGAIRLTAASGLFLASSARLV